MTTARSSQTTVPAGVWVVMVLVAGAFAAGAIGMLLSKPDGAAAPSRETAEPETRLHRNSEAGFEVRSPVGWEVTESGSTTRLASPDRSTIVTVAPGPSGSLEEASDRLLASVEASYSDVRLAGTEPESIFGNPALVAGGTAVNDRGDPVRFLAIVIDGPGENYAMTAFVPEGGDPADVLPDLRTVVDSFRPPAPAAG